MSVSAKEFVDAINEPILKDLDAAGLTRTYLAKKLKRELNAKETKFIKHKGSGKADEVMQEILEGLGKAAKKTKPRYTMIREGSEECVIAIDCVAWDVQQRARMDAHKLRGDYPAEKHETKTSGTLEITIVDRYGDQPGEADNTP